MSLLVGFLTLYRVSLVSNSGYTYNEGFGVDIEPLNCLWLYRGIYVGCLVEMFKRSIVVILGTLEVDVNGEK